MHIWHNCREIAYKSCHKQKSTDGLADSHDGKHGLPKRILDQKYDFIFKCIMNDVDHQLLELLMNANGFNSILLTMTENIQHLTRFFIVVQMTERM